MAASLDGDGKLHMDRLGQRGSHALFPLWILKYLPNMTAAHISLIHGAQGPNSTIMTACAAGTQAVGEAFRLIARDDADMMLAGGADSRLDPLLMLAYSALGALSPAQTAGRRKCRGRSTASATASCWAKAPASWCWRSWSAPRTRRGRSTPRCLGWAAASTPTP